MGVTAVPKPWAAAGYEQLVERFGLAEIGVDLVGRVGESPGMRVLDVATGIGNVAFPAASAGAQVCGLDLTWDMLARSAQRAAETGAHLALVQGDAGALPFADASFDCVLSSLGVMFAPDHRRAAGELVRVCRPGGLIGVCSWTPDSIPGVVGRTVTSFLPGSAPEVAGSPLSWGSEEHVRELFAGADITLEFERVGLPVRLDLADAYLQLLADHSGPTGECRRLLSTQGRWEEARAEVAGVLEERNETPGDGWTASQEYLVAIARDGRGLRATGSGAGDDLFDEGALDVGGEGLAGAEEGEPADGVALDDEDDVLVDRDGGAAGD